MGDQIDFNELDIVKLSAGFDLSNFDCGDTDLNSFLKDDALLYQNGSLAEVEGLVDQIRTKERDTLQHFAELWVGKTRLRILDPGIGFEVRSTRNTARDPEERQRYLGVLRRYGGSEVTSTKPARAAARC